MNKINYLHSRCFELESKLLFDEKLTLDDVQELSEIQIKATHLAKKMRSAPPLDITEKQIKASLEDCDDLVERCRKLTQKTVGNPSTREKVKEPFNPLQKQISEAVFPVYEETNKYKNAEKQLVKLHREAEEILAVLNSGKEKNPDKINKLQKRIESIEHEVARLNTKIQKYQEHAEKRRETHQLFTAIGGEQVKLVTKDRAVIDGMFLDANKFRDHLKQAGGQKITLTRTLASGEKQALTGIAFDKKEYEKSPEHVLKILKELNALSTNLATGTRMGSGWTLVHDGDRVILTSDEQLLDLLNSKFDPDRLLDYNSTAKEFYIRPEPKGSHTKREMASMAPPQNRENSTAIITSGNAGVYEMHKQEALYFLFKGMNVFLFNFRGYGESEGLPSETGCNIDYETACEYVKKRTGCENRQLLIKALCISGGAAAHAAKCFPESNIFFDQTYSDFREITKGQITEQSQKFLEKVNFPKKGRKTISEIGGTLGSIFTPSWHPAKDLPKNRGGKLFLFSTEDDLIPFSHMEKFTQTLLSEGVSNKSLTLVPIQGWHGMNWLDNWDRSLEKTNDWEASQQRIADLTLKIQLIEKEIKEIRRDGLLAAQQLEELGQPEKGVKYITKAEKKIGSLVAEIETIEKEIKKQETVAEPSLERRSHAARNQVDQFLKRLDLTDEIMPSQ